MTVYYRRESFHLAPNKKPKWHIFASSRNWTVTALCGYSHNFILESIMQRAEIKTRKLVCDKCSLLNEYSSAESDGEGE